jgi:hypothetical protein
MKKNITIQFNQQDYQLDEDAYGYLKSLSLHPGFAVFQELLRKQFVIEYSKLRDYKRGEEKYARLCGKLDGIEFALNVVDEELKMEIDHNPE